MWIDSKLSTKFVNACLSIKKKNSTTFQVDHNNVAIKLKEGKPDLKFEQVNKKLGWKKIVIVCSNLCQPRYGQHNSC